MSTSLEVASEHICTVCGSSQSIKYGRVSGIQRYRCAKCGHQFLAEFKRMDVSESKRIAFLLYHSGVPARMIGQMLQVTQQSIYRWMREANPSERSDIQQDEHSIEVSSAELVRYFVQQNKRYQAKNMWIIPKDFPSGWNADIVIRKPAFRRLPASGEPLRVGVMGEETLKGIIFDETTGRFRMLKDNFVSLCKKRLNVYVSNVARARSTVLTGKRYYGRYRANFSGCVYMFLMFGGNDCNYDWDAIAKEPNREHQPACSLELFREKYTALITEIKRDGIMPVLLSLPPVNANRYYHEICKKRSEKAIRFWMNSDIDYIRRWHEMYNLAIFNIGLDFEIPVFDITSPFFAQRNADDYLCLDGVHPNAAGHQLIADAICRHVESLSPFISL